MGGTEMKLTPNGWVRVPRDRGQRVVQLQAAQVRGCNWRVTSRPTRGRMASFNDAHHQPASGAGRKTPARGGSSDK